MNVKSLLWRKWLSLALAGLLASSCLVSCGGDGEQSTPTTEAETQAPAGETDEQNALLLSNGERALYRIVYPMIANTCLNEAMQLLKSGLEAQSGVRFSAISDVSEGERDTRPEILLGGTSYAESKAALEQLKSDAYSITVSGDRVVIVASNEGLYATAVERFLADCTAADGRITFKKDYSYVSESHRVLTLAENGTTNYKIVYDHLSEDSRTKAETIQAAMQKTLGVKPELVKDSSAPTGNYEILVGNTDRKLSSQTACYFKEYGIQFQWERRTVSLTGDLDAAVTRFCQLIESIGSAGELRLPEPVFGVTVMDGYGRIPAFREKIYDRLIDSEYHSFYVLYSNATAEEFNAYVERITSEEGFVRYASREVNGNLFATLTDGSTVLSVTYIKHESRVRISAETLETVSLAPAEQQTFEAVTTPQLTQINGACAFLLRLSDGRFLVMDGGLNRTENVEALYEQLVAQNVLGDKPVIAAWLLSHPHSDHYGGFIGFSEKYAGKVTLERVVLSLPSEEIYSTNTEASDVTPSIKNIITKAKDIIRVKYPKAALTVPHAGQVMWFADAMVDMLYTHEDLSPNVMKATNSSTLIYTVSIAGQRIAFLNDAHDDSSEIVYKTYGATLKCDIVQIAHHGYNGGNKNMYACFAADTALWTSPYATVVKEGLWNNPRNNFDINSVKENLMMSNPEVMVMPLPHAVGALPDYARTFS